MNDVIQSMGYDPGSYIAGFLAGALWTTVFAFVSGSVLICMVWLLVRHKRMSRRLAKHRGIRQT